MKLNLNNYEMEHEKEVKVRGLFINRELSLLQFDRRVLYYATDKEIPMNERLKFLAITDSNLDEFLSVRFTDAYHNKDKSPYKDILASVIKFKQEQDNSFDKIKKDLEKLNVNFVKMKDLNKKEKAKVHEEYMTNIFPLLTPVSINNVNFVPNVPSGEVCIAVTILQNGGEDMVVIPIDTEIDLIYQLNDKVLLTEDIIMYFMNDTLFINKEITSKAVFTLNKDASVILSHDKQKFIVDRMNDTLIKRNNSDNIFLSLRKDSDERLLNMLVNIFKVPKNHVYTKSKVLNYKRFMHKLLDDSHSYEEYNPYQFNNYNNYYDMFELLKDQDMLLHHPYDSYDTIVKFLEHAANDKDVVAIKQTLYRVSSIDSPIVNALCTAARNGKKVSVLIEIKARFDEENNIRLIKKLQNSGATVLLGVEMLKTHCKMCIVIRREKDKLKLYSHVATGNYNEKTAKIYTDLSYLTSKQKIGNDLLLIFNILTGYSNPDEKLQKIYYAPVTLRNKLLQCIDNEVKFAKKGKKAEIFMKINSLSDEMMAEAIYKAADAGVKIYIICRGVCSIVPRKNIFIKSIVGRYLEHSRIYYFRNGGDGTPEYFISSADLLTRNLDKRVETLISLKDSNVIEKLKWIIQVYKNDDANSFIMNRDGSWKHDKGSFSCHDWFMENIETRKAKKSWKI